METSVIKDDDCALRQFWQEDFLEPFVEQGAGTHAGEPQRCEQFSKQQCRHDTDADAAISGTDGEAAFAFRAASVGVGFIVIDAGFIHPDTQILWHFRQFLQESRSLFFAGFLVAIGLFFRV